MKNRVIIVIPAAVLLLAAAIMIFVNRNQADDAAERKTTVEEIVKDPVNTVAAATMEAVIAEKNREPQEISANDLTEMQTAEKEGVPDSADESMEAKETVSVTAESMGTTGMETSTENAEEPASERAETAEEPEGTAAVQETKEPGGEKEHPTDQKPEETSETEESSSLNLWGDDEENNRFICDEVCYDFIIENLCDPRFYNYENSEKCHEDRYNLSERYKKDHPYSEGSILKPYYPDVDEVYGFTGSFEDRELVVKAYDTAHNKKFFLIKFTIADGYKLDTVTIRELADNEVIE